MPSPIAFGEPLQELKATRHPGGSSVNNLRILDQLTKEHSPRTTLEIGLGPGNSALLFAYYHQAAGHGSGAHTAIDPYQTSPTAFASAGLHALQRAGLTEFVTLRNGLSALELPRLVADGTAFDMIYVDGSHLFEERLRGRLLLDAASHAKRHPAVRRQRACTTVESRALPAHQYARLPAGDRPHSIFRSEPVRLSCRQNAPTRAAHCVSEDRRYGTVMGRVGKTSAVLLGPEWQIDTEFKRTHYPNLRRLVAGE